MSQETVDDGVVSRIHKVGFVIMEVFVYFVSSLIKRVSNIVFVFVRVKIQSAKGISSISCVLIEVCVKERTNDYLLLTIYIQRL